MTPDSPLTGLPSTTPATARHVRMVATLALIVGGALHLVFYTGPSIPLAVSVALIGGGIGGYALFDMYERHGMSPDEFEPYLFGMAVAVTVISAGVGYGYIDRRVGVAYLAVLAVMIMAFTRVFEYQPNAN